MNSGKDVIKSLFVMGISTEHYQRYIQIALLILKYDSAFVLIES